MWITEIKFSFRNTRYQGQWAKSVAGWMHMRPPRKPSECYRKDMLSSFQIEVACSPVGITPKKNTHSLCPLSPPYSHHKISKGGAKGPLPACGSTYLKIQLSRGWGKRIMDWESAYIIYSVIPGPQKIPLDCFLAITIKNVNPETEGMALWTRSLGLKTWGPEFESPGHGWKCL